MKKQETLTTYTQSNFKQLINFSTRICHEQSSLIDLLLVNDEKLVASIKSEPRIGLRDHVVITAIIQLNLKTGSTHKVQKPNSCKANYKAINKEISQKNTHLQVAEETTHAATILTKL
ncbi:unnamed protein product [Psylliodes chrysocephalus]|uniref:Uncharacterized protein n=1 Tax=Psylliodes chrysocephalus TaxID=3402493 RepID=A0A9P0CGT0_9CUCU|nr:unnamed protein product [Psylliodes chrysocephala]